MAPNHPWVETAAALILLLSFPVSAFVAWRVWKRVRDQGPPPSQVPPVACEPWELALFAALLVLLAWGSGKWIHLAAAGCVLVFLGYKEVPVGPLWNMRFSPGGAIRHLGEAIVLYLAVLPLIALGMVISLGVGQLFGWNPDMQGAVRLFMEARTPAEVAVFLLLACAAAPIGEEIVFRGLLYPVIKTWFGRTTALVGTSVLFGAMHGHWASFLSLTLLGVVLALVYDSEGKLGRAIALHAVFNTATCALLLASKYLPRA